MGNWDEAHHALLAEATSARALDAPLDRAGALHRVATRTMQAGAKSQARALWEEAAVAACAAEKNGAESAATLLGEIAIELAKVGDLESATYVAGAIAHGSKRERAMSQVRALAKGR